MDHPRVFTYRSARSGSLMAGIALALLVETVVLHYWLVAKHPLLAWVLTLVSLTTLAWLAADYAAMGHGAIRLDDDSLRLDIGRRFSMRLPRGYVTSAIQPAWRDLPEAGTPAAAGYLNFTKPAQPNVLLTLREPVTLRLVGGVRRPVQRIGLHVDDPQRLVAELTELPSSVPEPS